MKKRKIIKNKRIKQRKMSKKKRKIRRHLFWLDGRVIKKRKFYVRFIGESFEKGSENDGHWWVKAIKGKLYRCTQIYYDYGEKPTYLVRDETGNFHIYSQADIPREGKIHNVKRYELPNKSKTLDHQTN